MRATMSDQFLRYRAQSETGEEGRMSESMVERVARAIYESEEDSSDAGLGAWENVTPNWRTAYLRHARAAIEAMREPLSDMLVAGQTRLADYEDYGAGLLPIEATWKAMISAALSESVPATSDPSGLDLPDLG